MARKNQVFGALRRQKLLRTTISGGEALAGILSLAALLLAAGWVAAQRDAYDPRERDVSMETLLADSVQDTLYKTPLERWRDPSLGPAGMNTPAVDLGPFPSGVLGDGWIAPSRVQKYTAENLYEKINGQAEQYLKFGFRELSVLGLEHPDEQASIDVFLYEQGSFADGLGLFEEQRGSKQVKQSGKAVYVPTRLGAYGLVGSMFFHVIGSEESERVTRAAGRIVAALGSLQGGDAPVPFTVLREGLGLPFEGIAYSPQNTFQFGFASRFWFGKEDLQAKARSFVHQAESAEAARELFGKLHAEQQEEFEVLEGSEREAVYRHKFLKTHFVLRLAGTLVYGVEKHPDRAGAEEATERLGSALFPAEGEGDQQ